MDADNPPPTLHELGIAYHEAGRVLVARLLGVDVLHATIVSADGAGEHRQRFGQGEHAAMIHLAGGIAQRRYLDASDEEIEGYVTSLEDLAKAEALIRGVAADRQDVLDAKLTVIFSRVTDFLDRHWPAVERIASRLAHRKTLPGTEIDECIRLARM